MKIAIFAYGSLVRNLYSRYSKATLSVLHPFEQSGCEIPTSFQDLSCNTCPDKRRLCLLATSENSLITRNTPLYYSTHSATELDLAIANFMSREGTSDEKHIACLFPPKSKKNSSYSPLSFHQEKVNEIELWLEQSTYDCGLIAQFPPQVTIEEIKLFLKSDLNSHKRTLLYFLGLPEIVQKIHRDPLEFLGLDFSLTLDPMKLPADLF